MADSLLRLGDAVLVADLSGALWWEEERCLVAADLHLEKGSAYARRGQMLPPYDTIATLDRLADAVARRLPRTIVLLGDSFHDRGGPERLDAPCRARLEALAQGRTLIWIAGNHDPALPASLPGERGEEIALGALAFRHTPAKRPDAIEVAGHLHPAAKVVTRGGSLRRRCFVSDGRRVLLPAFGAYAGGLNVRDPAIAGLFSAPETVAFVMGLSRVFPVRGERLSPD